MKIFVRTGGLLLGALVGWFAGAGPAPGATVRFSTFLGGVAPDAAHSVAVGSDGAAFVVGGTLSNDFPLLGPGPGRDESRTDVDMFAVKFLASGALAFATYLGGTGNECSFHSGVPPTRAADIIVDARGCAVIVGRTGSADFPTRAPLQSSLGGSHDAVIVKLASSGSALLFSTFLGGRYSDAALDADFDREGQIWVAGWTNSSDFPTRSPVQARAGDTDAFLCRLAADGSELLFSTLLGGSGTDQAFAVAADSRGGAWTAGATDSRDFPVREAWQDELVLGDDAFVSHFNPGGSGLASSTYLGGVGDEAAYGLAVDSSGCPVAAGSTDSVDFPCLSAFQEELGGSQDGFVCKFIPEGRRLVYATFLGGLFSDWCSAVALDQLGAAYLTGVTISFDFPLRNAYDSIRGAQEAFVAVIPPWGGEPSFSTYLGGSSLEWGAGIAHGGAGLVYVAGSVKGSSDFPLVNAYQDSLAFGVVPDAFVSVFDLSGSRPHPGRPGDFNGDGASEAALFLPETGEWLIRGVARPRFGAPDDVPVPADYDGDGVSDLAVFRPSLAEWCVSGLTRFWFGAPGDLPLPGDYDGDCSCAAAVFRESCGFWAIAGLTRVFFGSFGDQPSPADYDGDGSEEIAVFRPRESLWAVRGLTRTTFGGSGQIPVPADYDGDGSSEMAVFGPLEGLWAVRGGTRFHFGAHCARPVPGDYDGDGRAAAAVYDDSRYLWMIRGTTSFVYGAPGAIPVAR